MSIHWTKSVCPCSIKLITDYFEKSISRQSQSFQVRWKISCICWELQMSISQSDINQSMSSMNSSEPLAMYAYTHILIPYQDCKHSLYTLRSKLFALLHKLTILINPFDMYNSVVMLFGIHSLTKFGGLMEHFPCRTHQT